MKIALAVFLFFSVAYLVSGATKNSINALLNYPEFLREERQCAQTREECVQYDDCSCCGDFDKCDCNWPDEPGKCKCFTLMSLTDWKRDQNCGGSGER